MRAWASATLVVFLAHLLVPACIVVDFLLDQDRIARELCVQRLVPDEMRTCHGHCYLSKKLKEVDARERDLPDVLRSVKLDDALAQRTAWRVCLDVDTGVPLWPSLAEDELPGHVPVSEPVPWG